MHQPYHGYPLCHHGRQWTTTPEKGALLCLSTSSNKAIRRVALPDREVYTASRLVRW
jgi:hypothetical protein